MNLGHKTFETDFKIMHTVPGNSSQNPGKSEIFLSPFYSFSVAFVFLNF